MHCIETLGDSFIAWSKCRYATFPAFVSPPGVSSRLLLRPARCAAAQMLRKHRLPLSAGAGRSCQSLQLLFDESISNDTFILTPHCLFFLYDEIRLERHATGRIIKTWLKREEPRSSPETTHDNFCHTGIKNMTG